LTGIKAGALLAADDAWRNRERRRDQLTLPAQDENEGRRDFAARGRTTVGDEVMYKHILIASDGSELAGRAVEQGLTLAKTLGSKVTALTVTEPWTAAVSGEWAVAFPVEEYEKAAAANAQKILSDVSKTAAGIGVACETIHVKDQFAAEGIVEEAKNRSCDLIVMGSHGRRGIAKFVLGSQANRVLTHSTTPMLIVR
jgi:nucleotide-binding universal stress UspA family protein